MKRFAARAFWICAVLVLLGLGCRLLWTASRTETGLETLRLQWRDATCGVVLGSRTPIHSREPTNQAEFWLREVDRVLAVQAGNAQVAMGAALVLDSPSPGYAGRYLKKNVTIPGWGASPQLDRQRLKEAEETFELRCGEKSLALAADATTFDPANLEWWRLRAMLLWRDSMFSDVGSPRAENWVEVLDQCAEHDADNGLYDYLAAHFYWKSSAEIEVAGAKVGLVVTDAERFKRGIDRFARGQEKPFFAVGDADVTAVAEFLRYTRVPLTDHAKVVYSRGIHLRRSLLLRDVWRWQGLRADQTVAAGDVIAALTMQRQNLRLINQYTTASVSNACDIVAVASATGTAVQMSTLAKANQDLLSPEELKEVDALLEAAALESEVIDEADRVLATNRPQSPSGTPFAGSFATVLGATVVGLSPSLAVVLLLVGLAALVLSRVAANRELATLGTGGQVLSLAAACGVTLVVFGLAPSRIIPGAVQAWVLTILLVVTPFIPVAWTAWSWLRRRAFRFSLRALLIWMFMLCALFGVVSMVRPRDGSFSQLPFALSIPARGWEGLDAAQLEKSIRPRGEWHWAVLQWTAYYGQYLTVAVWAAFATVLLHFKLRGANAQAGGHPLTLRDHVRATSRSFGQAALKLSPLILVIYLALAPTVVAQGEQEFQRKMAYARQPSDHWSRVEIAVQQVKSDQELMGQLRATVKAAIAKETAIELGN